MREINSKTSKKETRPRPAVSGTFFPALFTALIFGLFLHSPISRAASLSGGPASAAARTSVTQARQSGAVRAVGVKQEETRGRERSAPGFTAQESWRIRIFEAAVVNGPTVLLGEIAAPAGAMPEELWKDLSARELWPAPEESGPGLSLTRPRLQQAVLNSLGQDLAALCLYPPSITLQRGGKILDGAAVQKLTVSTLTPLLASLPGEVSFSDFRLPAPVFLAHPAQELELEPPALPAPGRLSLRYNVREVDGSVARRLTGSVFVDCWAVVPCLTIPVNRGEVLSPEHITFVRKNLAYLRDAPWDGRGGPWQALRPISVDQPILLSDLTYVPTIKKGSIVRLVFESSTVRLSATVEALADGVSGETIPVRNLQSKRRIYAVVFDADTVMAFSGAMRPRGADIPGEAPETRLPAQAER
ncbi:MAG: flagellar basal body P-ring formation chaperone FlgA [Deltaproteobacteria bacterium]|jgi:flagella basal body P-ring formation protein FlgA|nr:flagellar basal body P-ring formation chaperone FlgA [Deltaproteobacteria bacterium]